MSEAGSDRTGTIERDPLLEAALGSMPYGFSVWDPGQRLILFNRRYLDMYGYPEERVFIGMPLRAIAELSVGLGNHPGFTAEEYYATIAARFRATADDPGHILRAQKAVRDRVIKTNHIRVPALGWIVTHEDVTEEVELARLAAERAEALKAHHLVFEAAIESMESGLSLYDGEMRLVACNSRYRELYGLTEDETRPGTPFAAIMDRRRETGAITEDLGDDATAEISDIARRGDTKRQVWRLPDGRVVQVHHSPTPGGGFVATHTDITRDLERLEALGRQRQALESQNMRFEAAVENMSQGLCMFDAEERLVICNAAYRAIYGLPAELVRRGTPHADIVAWRERNGMQPVKGARSFMAAHWRLRKDETSRRVRIELADGRIISIHHRPTAEGGWVATHQDVTDELRRVARLEVRERDLAIQNMRFEAAVGNISQGLCMFDGARRLVICNTAYARIYNLPPELMVPGTTLERILEYRFDHGMVPVGGRDHYREGRDELVRKRMFARDLIEMEDGRAIAISHHPMADGGWVATHEDVTEQRRSEARIRHLARHDALTDLPNRIFFREEMEKAEARMRRGETVAVLCVDLDHFKAINDTQGHAVGDGVLRCAGERLREAAGGMHLVARLGGDEFAILASGLAGPEDAALIAARVVKHLGEPMQVEGITTQIGASVGIAVAPTDGGTGDALLNNADLALYRSKTEGRGTYHFFERGMDRALQDRRALEQGLRLGLSRREFRLVFQPLVSLPDNRICCLEALLRWDHPERGTISPAEFIPIAEETGAIVPIGEWVLGEACRAAAAWPGSVRVAVNLSPVQFKHRGLVDQVTRALAEAGLAADRLELEITESLLLADTRATIETLHRLRALGVRISMDDFGTGYSSLSYLRSFPFDKIKIDRSFIADLTPSPDSRAIIKAVIDLGQSLGMATTAEGVETEEQLAAVTAQGCNEVQGFLFSPPLPAAGIEGLLRAWDGGARRDAATRPAPARGSARARP